MKALHPLLLAAAVMCGTLIPVSARKPSEAGPANRQSAISVTDLERLLKQKPAPGSRVTVSARLVKPDGEAMVLPVIETRTGQSAKVERLSEFSYPAAYDFPKVGSLQPPAGSTSYPVTPSTPKNFRSKDTGITLSVKVSKEAAFLLLEGALTDVAFEQFTCNPGEAFAPIVTEGRGRFGGKVEVVLSDNKVLTPQFTERHTPFYISAVSGNTYRLEVNSSMPGTVLEITTSLQP